MRVALTVAGLLLVGLVVGALAWLSGGRAPEDAGAAARPERPTGGAGADEPLRLHATEAGVVPEQRGAVAAAPSDDEPTAGATLPLRVRAVPSLASDEEGRVPHVRFELGLTGIAGSFGDDRPPGAPLLEGVTDERGEALVELPRARVEELARSGQVFAWARVLGDGFQRRLRRAQLVDAEGASADEPLLRLLAWRGATLQGTLLGRDGAPTDGAVRLEREVSGGWRRADGGNARADGRWALHFEEPGRHRLLATGAQQGRSRLRGRGTATLGPLELRLDASPEDVEVQLVGPGRLRGRVLDGAGQPAAGLDVLALSARADVGRGSFVVPDEIRSEYERAGAGHYWMTVTTDAEGRFDLDGLCDELFVVRARTQQRGGYPILLTPQPVSSTGGPLELRLSRPHLVVLLEDAAGKRADFEVVEGGGWDGGFPEEWPDAPRVLVAPAPGSAEGDSAWDLLLEGRVVGPGEATFELRDGSDYLAALLAPGGPPRIEPVHVDPGGGRTEVRFRLEAPRPTGAVVLDVVAPDGAPVKQELSVRFVDPRTRLCVLERARWWAPRGKDPWPARFELPAGEYELRVAGVPFVDMHHGTMLKPRVLGDWRRRVSVRAGVEERVTARLSPPAFLEVELRGEVSPADVDGIRERWPDSGDDATALLGWAGRATLRLQADGEYPVPVEFARRDMIGTSAEGIHLSDELELGKTERSEALSPGSYVLEARMPGGRTARERVELVGGETLRVTLDVGGGG